MEQVFHVLENGQPTGPFTFEQLKGKNIQRDTLVWTEGLDAWTKAEHIPVLRDILRATPPPPPNSGTAAGSTSQAPPPPIPGGSNTLYFGQRLALRRERFVANLLEVFAVFIIAMLIASAFDIGSSGSDEVTFGSYLSGVAIAAIFGAICYSNWSGNIGHKLLGLKVISAQDGSDQQSAKAGAIREGLKAAMGLLIIPSIWLLWDEQRQNLYDKVTRTVVVKKKPGS